MMSVPEAAKSPQGDAMTTTAAPTMKSPHPLAVPGGWGDLLPSTPEAPKSRTARKDHVCGRQARWDRMKPDAREFYLTHPTMPSSPCPFGGIIKAGEVYIELEGEDEFHPTRVHPGCESFA